jgi:hypothetical protein
MPEENNFPLLIAEPEFSAVACPFATSPRFDGLTRSIGGASFVLLACNGLWNVMATPDACAAAVAALELHGDDCTLAAQTLARKAVHELGATGNVSVLLVLLSPRPATATSHSFETPAHPTSPAAPDRRFTSRGSAAVPSVSADAPLESPGGSLLLRGAGRQLMLDDF